MLVDLAASPHTEKVKIPLPDFLEAQCSALLTHLYNNSASSKGGTFAYQAPDDLHFYAAVAVARFAHVYDVPHALRHVEAFLTTSIDTRFPNEKCGGMSGWMRGKVLELALMADKFDMRELHARCERTMVMYWDNFQLDLVDQLSRKALLRVTIALNRTLLTSTKAKDRKYPDVRDFTSLWEWLH